MSIIEASENRLESYFKRLGKFYGSAKSKAEGDEHKFLELFLYFWNYLSCSENDLLDMCADELSKAIAEKNYPLMRAIMYFADKSNILWNGKIGCDHSYLAYHMVKYLSSAEYADIYRAFPEGLPPASNGHTMNINAANLILCILYKDSYDAETAADKARKYIFSKQPRWDSAFVACLLGILEQDTVMISDNIQTICEMYSRTDLTSFEKMLCQFAYGILVIAYNNLPLDKYELIRYPEYKNFDAGYLKWLLKGEFTGEKLIEYPEPYEALNAAMSAPISVTKVHQPYLNENVSARQKKLIIMDGERMNDELIGYIMRNF